MVEGEERTTNGHGARARQCKQGDARDECCEREIVAYSMIALATTTRCLLTRSRGGGNKVCLRGRMPFARPSGRHPGGEGAWGGAHNLNVIVNAVVLPARCAEGCVELVSLHLRVGLRFAQRPAGAPGQRAVCGERRRSERMARRCNERGLLVEAHGAADSAVVARELRCRGSEEAGVAARPHDS